MNPDNMQQENNLTPEEAKASLGLATRLSEQMLMAQMGGGMQPEGTQDAPNGQGGELDQENGDSSDLRKQYENGANNEPDNDKLDEVLDEIKSIKEEIKKVLEEDDTEENNENENEQKD